MIEPGTEAPGFTLSDQDGNEVSLSDLRGERVVLVFYPADFSPTCTDQLSSYQVELLPKLDERARIFGISVDSAFCHKAFQDHLGVTIPLLADFHPKGEVAKAYDVWSESHGCAGRVVVVVGPDGVVEWAHEPPSPLEVPGADLITDALVGIA
jgi:peroxiredoxin